MEYEINRNTQAILPIDINCSKVIENGREYVIENNTFEIMEHSCEYFGSSYEGRKEGTKKLLGLTHKVPIIVEESQKIIFFPTTSCEREECIWINLNLIDKYYSKNKKESIILFTNGDELEFNISIGSLNNQILRATRLKYILDKRLDRFNSEKEDDF